MPAFFFIFFCRGAPGKDSAVNFIMLTLPILAVCAVMLGLAGKGGSAGWLAWCGLLMTVPGDLFMAEGVLVCGVLFFSAAQILWSFFLLRHGGFSRNAAFLLTVCYLPFLNCILFPALPSRAACVFLGFYTLLSILSLSAAFGSGGLPGRVWWRIGLTLLLISDTLIAFRMAGFSGPGAGVAPVYFCSIPAEGAAIFLYGWNIWKQKGKFHEQSCMS